MNPELLNKDTNYSLPIISFCVIAAIRVFLYSISFPFFSNVDEQWHFDLVLKYSEGHFPKSLETMSPHTAEYVVKYESQEYFKSPDYFPEHHFPVPIWKYPESNSRDYINQGIATWSSDINHDSLQPPLYYMIAGAWAKLGNWLGFNGGYWLYWIRWLNVLLIVLLVWISYRTVSLIYPGNKMMILGVPLFTAILPQDTFYSIQSDVLSPVCFGLAFLYLIRFVFEDKPRTKYGVIAGLSLVATILVKNTNLPLLLVSFGILVFAVYRWKKIQSSKEIIKPVAMFVVSGYFPVILWFLYNHIMHGDITASESKIQFLAWTHKPISVWINHPIFTANGLWLYWKDTIVSYWRGEFNWYLKILALPAMDIFYCVSSFAFVIIGAFLLRSRNTIFQKQINCISLWVFISLLLFMILLSISFDYGDCTYPSQAYPYFASGRLISASLIPFLILYVQGLEKVLCWIKSEMIRVGILAVLAIIITISEIIINLPAFFSEFNMFNL
jgi:Predicted membrane protein (DUF2142)